MILKGDCIEVMKAMKPNSVDAVVTDPPYGLEFMGKNWDKLWRHGDSPAQVESWGGFFKGKNNPRWRDVKLSEWQSMQLWHTQWLTEAYRVLKPGGSMLVMGGTRTFHRLACAIEDSGFIIKDTLMWLYGSGFPKAQDLVKLMKKKTDRDDLDYSVWDGFKVGGIKPAYEPIIWAVKPPEGSYIDNVLKWGVGAVNVDECRIGYQNNEDYQGYIEKRKSFNSTKGSQVYGGNSLLSSKTKHENRIESKGRFPANIILDEEVARMLDKQGHGYKTHGGRSGKQSNGLYGKFGGEYKDIGDNGGPSRFFYCAKASRSERNRGLEGMENITNHGHYAQDKWSRENMGNCPDERRKSVKNNHPTVKPIALFEWLIKLVTCKGQIILDPFLGSGTTSISARNTERKCIGIEREDEYLKIAKRRVDYWKSQPKQMEMGI